MVKFLKPNPEMIKHIADNMREADAVEVWEMSRQTPIQSIEEGLRLSDFSAVVTVNDIPCAVLGLVVVDILTGTGVPWLLGTDHAVRQRRVFLSNCERGIKQMVQICPNLFNYVHAENKISVRWLSHMGFTVEDPMAMGEGGAMFHKFSMGNC